MAEEIDELSLQRLRDGMRVNVDIQVAQLDEKVEADIPV